MVLKGMLLLKKKQLTLGIKTSKAPEMSKISWIG